MLVLVVDEDDSVMRLWGGVVLVRGGLVLVPVLCIADFETTR